MKAATRNPNRGRNGSTSWIAKSTRYAIYHRDGWRCVYCRFVVSSKSATLDHLKPESKGGTHAATNLVTACGRCNSRRGATSVISYVRSLSFGSGRLDVAEKSSGPNTTPSSFAAGSVGGSHAGPLLLQGDAAMTEIRVTVDDETLRDAMAALAPEPKRRTRAGLRCRRSRPG
jgi:hypothetical protein